MAPTPSPPHPYSTFAQPTLYRHGRDEIYSNPLAFPSGSSFYPNHAFYLPPPLPPVAPATSGPQFHHHVNALASSSAPHPAFQTGTERVVTDFGPTVVHQWHSGVSSSVTVDKSPVQDPSLYQFQFPPSHYPMTISLRSRRSATPPLVQMPAAAAAAVVRDLRTSPPAAPPPRRHAAALPVMTIIPSSAQIHAEINPASDSPATETESSSRQDKSPSRPKEKRHGCKMCYKSFDRPSTLKKHMLVHTGEKAYTCELCGRRFGVLSNLNRHARRCAEKPINTAKVSSPSDDASSAQVATTSETSSKRDRSSRKTGTNAQGSTQSHTAAASTSRQPYTKPSAELVSDSSPEPAASAPTSTRAYASKAKRRRRPPSPSNWIPASLLNLDLSPYPKSALVPLSPVTPSGDLSEERNSYDENWGVNPYHPRYWTGRLPGPALPGKGVPYDRRGILVFQRGMLG